MRFFNTAGPVMPKEHYCLPPLSRFDLAEIKNLIRQKKYFILHAPRQVGKTSYLLDLMDHLNKEGKYHCLYVNVESAQAAREKVNEAVKLILSDLASNAEFYLNDTYLSQNWPGLFQQSGAGALGAMLSRWARHSQKPLILLIDEIDSLVGDTLISVLRQLRAGYSQRPAGFPQGVLLCGVRDLHDYRIHSDKEKTVITGGSAFNIKAESLRLGDFCHPEVEILLQQHTVETGQMFDPGVIEQIWELTSGQPWLVNALAYEVCFKMKAGRDRSQPITGVMIQRAKENLIQRRETHLDQLADKLVEERVRRVIQPILAGEDEPEFIPPDDIDYVYDLGLIKKEGQLKIANRIYMEVIPRKLTYSTQLTISHQPAWYIAPDGHLDLNKLLAAFQQFFRKHSEHWVERFDYREAGPQLLLQAFLQRIVNNNGRIDREYGLGRMRTDLLVIWQIGDKVQQVVLELKIRYGDTEKTIIKGLEQTFEYMDRSGTTEGHLIIFDRRETVAWDEKIFRQERTYQDQAITVWGM